MMQLKKIFAVTLPLLLALSAGAVPVSQFGAVGDGATDDSEAIGKALNSDADIEFDGKTYLLGKQIHVIRKNNKTIDFGKATLVRDNLEHYAIRFADCTQLRITGGIFLCKTMPEEYAKSVDAHALLFVRSTDISVSGVFINGSGQMGICVMDCHRAIFRENTIMNCFRDGIYSHFSTDVSYLDNRLSHIKDDALSFHDYGDPNRKSFVLKAGYKQSGRLIARGNVIRNAYQGIASIGCEAITIEGNLIDGTVNAGICVFNSDHYSTRIADANVRNVIISGNTILNACKSTRIMKKEYPNGLDSCTARAAITAQSQGKDMLMPSATRRLSGILIADNLVRDSGTAGIQGHYVDTLHIIGNIVLDCNVNGKEATGNILEAIFCTDVLLRGNTVTDSRSELRHKRAWSLRKSTGIVEGNQFKGFRTEEGTREEAAPYNWNP